MIKKDVIKITPRNSIDLKCGDCLHFKRTAKFEKPCSLLGVKRFASAPACYSPDVYVLARKSPDALTQLGLMLSNFTPSESRVFMALLKQQKTLQKSYKLRFGQPVYFKIGNDYLSNYFRGVVVGVAEAGESQVFVTSTLSDTQRQKPMSATLMRDSCFTVTEFVKKKQQLVNAGLLKDPKPLYTVKASVAKKAVDINYEPPTMETAPKEWYDKDLGARLSSKMKLKRGSDNSVTFTVDRDTQKKKKNAFLKVGKRVLPTKTKKKTATVSSKVKTKKSSG